jgi:hypothetical protein
VGRARIQRPQRVGNFKGRFPLGVEFCWIARRKAWPVPLWPTQKADSKMKAQDSQVAKFVKALPNPTPLKTVSWCGFLESFPFRLDFVGMAERVCSLKTIRMLFL